LWSEHTFPKFDDILKLYGNYPEPSDASVTVVSDNALDLNLFSSPFAFRPPLSTGGYLTKCSVFLHRHWRNFDDDRSALIDLCITTRIRNKYLDTFA
jgi:hypothetical protein